MTKHTVWALLAGTLLIGLPSQANAFYATYDPVTGEMTINSQGLDLVAVFIEGPDVSQSGCNLCDGMNLPGEDALATASTWTLGFINGSSQWIRTNPLQGRGFVGEIANYYIDGGGVQQPWPDDVPPFLDFPDAGGGIANYGPGLGLSDFGIVTLATDDGSTITTGLWIPEPVFSPWLLGVAALLMRKRSRLLVA